MDIRESSKKPVDWLVEKLKTARLGYLLLLSVIVSEICSGSVVSLMSLLLRGQITQDYLVTSAVTAFIAPIVVVSIILVLIQHLLDVENKLTATTKQLTETAQTREEDLKTAEALLAASSAIIDTLDLSSVLLSLASHLSAVSRFPTCIIYHWDGEHAQATTAAEYGRVVWPPREEEIYRIEDYPTSERVLESGQAELVERGVHEDESVWMGIYGAAASMIIPLCSATQVIGLVEVAVADRSLFSDTNVTTRCQQIVRDASNTLLSPLRANTTADLMLVLERLADLVGQSACSISLWDKPAREIRTVVERVDMTWPIPYGAPARFAERTLRHVVGGKYVILQTHDPDLDPRDRLDLELWGGKTILLIPLSARGKIVGLVELFDVDDRVVSHKDMRLWGAVANQAAVAVENAWLYAEAQKRLAAQTALRKAGMFITSALGQEVVLSRIAEQMSQAVDATSAYICGLDRSTRQSDVLAEHISDHASEAERVSDLGLTYSADYVGDDFLRGLELGQHRIDHVDRRDLPAAFLAHMQEFDAKSILYIPLQIADDLLGYVEIWESRWRREFTTDEIALCQDLATQAAVALKNARLYAQAQDEVAERSKAETELRLALEQKEVLLKEIHHRVKNNLQVISSLLSLQSIHIGDQQLAAHLSDSQRRVRAMALIHEKLYQSKDLSRIDFHEYLRSLLADLTHSLADSDRDITLTVEAEPLQLELDAAVPCGLIVSELVSNAFKHAFPNSSGGAIRVGLYTDRDQVKLSIADNGIGFPEEVNVRAADTLGLQLVQSLVEQLEGTLALECSDGSTFVITFPSVGGAQEGET